MTTELKPGTRFKSGAIEYLVCAVLNSASLNVNIPCMVTDQVIVNSKVAPVWPLGIYVAFTPEGVTLGIFGKDLAGAYVNGMSHQNLEEDIEPPMGEAIWNLWKELRGTSEEVIHKNFETLFRETREGVNSSV